MQNNYRFRILDVLILLLIATLLFGFVYFSVLRNGDQSLPTLTYTLEIDSLFPQVAKSTATGDSLYDTNGNFIGTVQSANISPSTYQVYDDGTILTRNHPEFVTLTVTVSATVTQTDPISVNGILFRIGQEYEIRSSHLTAKGRCTSLSFTNPS